MHRLLQATPLLAALLLLQVPAQSQQHGWFSDLSSASQLAKQRQLTLLIHVFGSQCPPCLRMEREVFSQPEIQTALTHGIVAVKLNGDANLPLLREWGVRSYPADVIFRPGLPKEVRHQSLSTPQYLALLQNIAAHTTPNSDLHKTRTGSTSDAQGPVNAPNPLANSTPRKTSPQSATSRPQPPLRNHLNSPLIGMDGFCPVTLHQRRILLPGKPELTALHEGIRYQFASAELRNAFNSDPTRFAPCVQGCDPITLAREQRAVPGSIRYGAWYAGNLYLFQSDANRQTFKASPVTWTKIQSAKQPSARARQ